MYDTIIESEDQEDIYDNLNKLQYKGYLFYSSSKISCFPSNRQNLKLGNEDFGHSAKKMQHQEGIVQI